VSNVVIAGVGMTPFGRFPGRGVRALTVAAVDEALRDAGVPINDVQRVFFGNAIAGVVENQEMIRGQVALRHHPLGRTSLINVENACASGGSALSLAFDAIEGGRLDVVLVVGAEQMNHHEKARAFDALRGSTDIADIGAADDASNVTNSILMDYYAGVARAYLEDYGATPADFAAVAVKNRQHARLNPLAHFQREQTIDDVLNSRLIVPPLTLPMCAPTTDGAAALVVCSAAYAKRLDARLVRLVTSHVAASPGDGGSPVTRAANAAYEASGMGAHDFDLIELHDAAAPAELLQYGEIGLCRPGDAHVLLNSGATRIGGRSPINASGGLLSRGHPLGATGCAQVVELVTQLQGRAGARQVENARVALAINGGGWLDGTYALAVSTIVERM